jgi:hypothetical protein
VEGGIKRHAERKVIVPSPPELRLSPSFAPVQTLKTVLVYGIVLSFFLALEDPIPTTPSIDCRPKPE